MLLYYGNIFEEHMETKMQMIYGFEKIHFPKHFLLRETTIKSHEEIVYVKKAAELADKALNEAWKHTKAGASEAKILAEMQKWCV